MARQHEFGWLDRHVRRVSVVVFLGLAGWRASGPLSETWATWQQVSLLGDPDYRVQSRAAAAIRLRGSQANRLLIGQIRVGNTGARAMACRLLAEDAQRNSDVLEALVLGLADSDDTVARTAAYALTAPLSVETWAARRYIRKGEYVRIPDPPYELLETAVPGWPVEAPRPQVGAALRQVARVGRSTTVRLAAIQAIVGWYGPSGPPDPWLLELLGDSDPGIAAVAARGLLACQRHEYEAGGRLRALLVEETPEPVREYIERILPSERPRPTRFTSDARDGGEFLRR